MAYPVKWLFLVLLVVVTAHAQSIEDDAHIDSLSKLRPADAAVDKALKWLVRQQHKSGAFPLTRNKLNSDNVHATTALACLALMAAGHFPDRSELGGQLRQGILFIVQRTAQNKGYLGGDKSRLYGHGMCTVALASAYGMMPDAQENRQVGMALQAAVQVILDAQREGEGKFAGGWHYEEKGDEADLCVSTWQLLALRAAVQCRLPVKRDVLDSALGFVRRTWDGAAQTYAYQPQGTQSNAMRAAGILSLNLLGLAAEADHEQINRAAKPLLSEEPHAGRNFYYTLFLQTLAASTLGGEHASRFLPRMRGAIRPLQQESGEFRKHSGYAGGVYATSMAVLSLCMDYQFLPVLQE
ncbi:MAG: hypothetical protein ACI8W8_001410 [Rhodothermales bacterium]|jgi:hypothetical protein